MYLCNSFVFHDDGHSEGDDFIGSQLISLVDQHAYRPWWLKFKVPGRGAPVLLTVT